MSATHLQNGSFILIGKLLDKLGSPAVRDEKIVPGLPPSNPHPVHDIDINDQPLCGQNIGRIGQEVILRNGVLAGHTQLQIGPRRFANSALTKVKVNPRFAFDVKAEAA